MLLLLTAGLVRGVSGAVRGARAVLLPHTCLMSAAWRTGPPGGADGVRVGERGEVHAMSDAVGRGWTTTARGSAGGRVRGTRVWWACGGGVDVAMEVGVAVAGAVDMAWHSYDSVARVQHSSGAWRVCLALVAICCTASPRSCAGHCIGPAPVLAS